jgi:cyclopropane fatty-acyl-phospholipid synthase-like methyltransferase
MMVDACISGLALSAADALLDIGCGNGALVARLFSSCDRCLGVDFSEYLISVANDRFASARHTFICREAIDYVEWEPDPKRFDKVLCFAVFSYLSDQVAERLLKRLRDRFVNVRAVFIGNIPDPECAHMFFKADELTTVELNNPDSQIGMWRTKSRVSAMAEQTGWRAHFELMPATFYQSHYRYNAVLERSGDD